MKIIKVRISNANYKRLAEVAKAWGLQKAGDYLAALIKTKFKGEKESAYFKRVNDIVKQYEN